jgi:hypothetical protein
VYTPKYLTFLDNSGTADGWPAFVTEDGKFLATNIALFLLRRDRPTHIDEVADRIFKYHPEALPDCFRGVALLDARYAVAHRALLAAAGKQVWVRRDAQ